MSDVCAQVGEGLQALRLAEVMRENVRLSAGTGTAGERGHDVFEMLDAT